MAKAAAKKPAAKKPTGKAAKSVGKAAKKPAAKSAGKAAKKPAAKAAGKKPAAKSAGKSAKKPAAKKTAAKKTAAKKPAAKKTVAKKTTAKKPVAKKPAAKSPAAKKPAAKKTSAASTTATTAKRSAVKKTTARGRAALGGGVVKRAPKGESLETTLGVSLPGKRVSKAPPPAELSAYEKRKLAARQTAVSIAEAALEKKAERIEIVDLGDKVDYADYLVLMTGRSDRQVVAIAGGIEDALRKGGRRPHATEGLPQGHWVLLDYSDVVVHVFLEEARKYYDLEGLWSDAPRIPLPAALAQAAAASSARVPSQ